MGTMCPSGALNDDSVVAAYNGCSIFCYYENGTRRQYVMIDPFGNVKFGTTEALNTGRKEKLMEKYNLELVRNIDGKTRKN